jgi:hypothetical protein
MAFRAYWTIVCECIPGCTYGRTEGVSRTTHGEPDGDGEYCECGGEREWESYECNEYGRLGDKDGGRGIVWVEKSWYVRFFFVWKGCMDALGELGELMVQFDAQF